MARPRLASSAPAAFAPAAFPAVDARPKKRGDAATASADEMSNVPAPEDFLSLWLPFELEIGRLSQTASPLESESDEGALQFSARGIDKRREILERLFADAQSGKASAQHAIQALEAVMGAFAARVERIVRRGELKTGDALAPDAALPGALALRELGNEADFLRGATAYAVALHAWLFEAVEAGEAERDAQKRGKPLRRARLPADVHFFNDAPHGVAVRGLAQAAKWTKNEEFAYAYDQLYADAHVTLGLRDGEGVKDLWTYLVKGGPRMVKAHYALWARYYEDVDEGGLRYAMISVPQFCADLGYTPHKNGGFRPEHKREALKMLEALTSIEMSVVKTLGSKERRLRGPLWARGFEAQERDVYGDLFGASRVAVPGSPESWEPVAFSFAPGPWFDDPEWRRYHRFIGKIGSGLLRLSGHTDQWPILIGGYLGTLARIGGYQTLRLKAGNILKKLDLAQTEDAARRVTQTREKLERALDRLAEPEIGVIAAWRFAGAPEIAEPDMDDPQSLSDYGAAEVYPPGDWRNWCVKIEFPFAADAARLQAGRAKARAKTARRAAAKRSRKA